MRSRTLSVLQILPCSRRRSATQPSLASFDMMHNASQGIQWHARFRTSKHPEPARSAWWAVITRSCQVTRRAAVTSARSTPPNTPLQASPEYNTQQRRPRSKSRSRLLPGSPAQHASPGAVHVPAPAPTISPAAPIPTQRAAPSAQTPIIPSTSPTVPGASSHTATTHSINTGRTGDQRPSTSIPPAPPRSPAPRPAPSPAPSNSPSAPPSPRSSATPIAGSRPGNLHSSSSYSQGSAAAPAAPRAPPPGRTGSRIRVMNSTDKLYNLLTDPGNELTRIEDVLKYRNTSHTSTLKHLVALHSQDKLIQQHLAALYGLSMEDIGLTQGIVGDTTTDNTLPDQGAHAAESSDFGCGSGSAAQEDNSMEMGDRGAERGARRLPSLDRLTWRQVQEAVVAASGSTRGKAKQVQAAVALLQQECGGAVSIQEASSEGLTQLQVELLSALQPAKPKAAIPVLLSDTQRVGSPAHSSDEDVAAEAVSSGVAALPLLPGLASLAAELTTPQARKVSAFLAGSSVEELCQPPLSGKKPVKMATVLNALLAAVKAGVALPQDRLLTAFQLEPASQSSTLAHHAGGRLRESDLRIAILRLHNQQADSSTFSWLRAVRDELLAAPATQDLVLSQEQVYGADITFKQVHLMTHIIRWRQEMDSRKAAGGPSKPQAAAMRS